MFCFAKQKLLNASANGVYLVTDFIQKSPSKFTFRSAPSKLQIYAQTLGDITKYLTYKILSIEKGFEFGQEDQEQLDKIIKKAERGDVTYDLNRWFGQRMRQDDSELLEIQKQGFISEAVSWLKSTTPEGMKYGKASKEERLAKAREFTEKA